MDSLKRLVKECPNNEARCSAELKAISDKKLDSRTNAVPFRVIVSSVLAEAHRLTQPRYQDLLDAFEHEPDAVSSALDRFVGGAYEYPKPAKNSKPAA